MFVKWIKDWIDRSSCSILYDHSAGDLQFAHLGLATFNESSQGVLLGVLSTLWLWRVG